MKRLSKLEFATISGGLGRSMITPSIARNIIMKKCPTVSSMIPGKLYFITNYDPKLKEKLGEWDSEPLVYCVDYTEGLDGVNYQGISLHFLPEGRRMPIINGSKLGRNETEKAFKEYIPDRISQIFLIEEPFQEIAVKTSGNIIHRKR